MKSDSIAELAGALVKAQSEIKPAIKKETNPFYKSKYADLHSVWLACAEALHKNGLSIVQTLDCPGTTFDHQNKTIVENNVLVTTLIHSSGQWIDGRCPLFNSKGDMQGLGSAISYARRYSIAAMCGVISDDDDANTADQVEKKIPKDNSFIERAKAADTTDYVIPLKKFHGKRFSDLKDYEITNYMDWIKRSGIVKPDFLEFVQQAEAYLGKYYKLKPSHPEEPPPFEAELNWGK